MLNYLVKVKNKIVFILFYLILSMSICFTIFYFHNKNKNVNLQNIIEENGQSFKIDKELEYKTLINDFKIALINLSENINQNYQMTSQRFIYAKSIDSVKNLMKLKKDILEVSYFSNNNSFQIIRENDNLKELGLNLNNKKPFSFNNIEYLEDNKIALTNLFQNGILRIVYSTSDFAKSLDKNRYFSLILSKDKLNLIFNDEIIDETLKNEKKEYELMLIISILLFVVSLIIYALFLNIKVKNREKIDKYKK